MILSSQQLTKTTARLKSIPPGKSGIRLTLKEMSKLVKDGKRNIIIRELALSIVSNLPPKCWRCEAQAIQRYVFKTIRYVRDIHGIETIATPEKTLEYRQGDCDDVSVLAASLLQSIGHPVRFIAVGFNNRPLSHVLIETLIGNNWYPAELTEPLPFGEYPRFITSKMIESIRL